MPTIEETGLKQYLDSTTAQHRNFGYDHFITMMSPDDPSKKLDTANIARAFGVNRNTIYRWIEFYKKENE